MRHTARYTWSWSLVASLLSGVQLASAQGDADSSRPRSAEYARLVEGGVSEYNAGRWAEARVLFERAHTLEPNARTFRGLGLTAFESRRYVEAVTELRASLGDAREPLTAALRRHVQQTLEQALEYVGMLDIYVEPAHAVLLLDGRQVAAKGLWLNVGDYRLRASARGFHASERDLHVNGDKPQQLKISLVPVEPRREAAATAAGGWQRPLGWVAATASLIGAAAGVVVAAQRASTLQARTEICPSGYNCGANDQARVDRLESLADDQKHLVRASFAGSGALLLSGVLLLLLAPTERSTAVAVRPVVGLDVIGARLCGRL